MSPIHSAQHLPEGLTHCILDYLLVHAPELITKSYRELQLRECFYYTIHPTMRQFSNLLPILGLCRSWRNAASKHAYSHAMIDMGFGSQGRWSLPKTPTLSLAAENSKSSLVRTVTIYVGLHQIVNGQAEAALSRAPLEDAGFSNVTQVRLLVRSYSDPEGNLADETNCSSDALRLRERILGLFPSAQVADLSEYEDWANISSRFMAKGFKTSVEFADEGSYYCQWKMLNMLMPGTGLTHISLTGQRYNSAGVIELVRRNANTLSCINLFWFYPTHLRLLIESEDGSNTFVYPHVERLAIYIPMFSWLATSTYTPPSCVPFPRLKHLVCQDRQPYDTDILFRGNSATLETVAIGLDITETGFFHGSSFPYESQPKLDYVHVSLFWVRFANGRRVFTTETKQNSIRSMLQVARCSKSLVVSLTSGGCKVDISFDELFKEIQRTSGFERLETLNLSCIQASPKQLLMLLRHIPTVRKLYIALGNNGQEYRNGRHLQQSDIERVFGESSQPVSSRLSNLQVVRYKGYTGWQVIEQMLVVASLILSLERISLYKHSCSNLVERVRRELVPQLPWPCPHLDQLEIFSR